MKRHIDHETLQITYERELHTKSKNILLILSKQQNANSFSLLAQTFNKRNGEFEQPRYIEHIKNDIDKLYLENKEMNNEKYI